MIKFKDLKKSKIFKINIVATLIALVFILYAYSKVTSTSEGMAGLEYFALLIWVIGPIYFVSSIIATAISKNKSWTIIFKSVLLLFIISFLIIWVPQNKNDFGLLVLSFFIYSIFTLVCSSLGYIITIVTQKFILKK